MGFGGFCFQIVFVHVSISGCARQEQSSKYELHSLWKTKSLKNIEVNAKALNWLLPSLTLHVYWSQKRQFKRFEKKTRGVPSKQSELAIVK